MIFLSRLLTWGLALLTLFGSIPAEADPGAKLTVSMVVDKVAARRGDIIRYQVRVENVGDGVALDVEVDSHIPSQTTATTDACPEGTFEPDGDICFQPSVPTPGLGDSVHQVHHGFGLLGPGEGFSLQFAVRVNDDAVIGSHLPNHAHATATLEPQVTSASVDTLVVGATPRGAFGGIAVTFSGGAMTDSYDSSGGPYSVTRSASNGDIGSNGNIGISGGAVINGTATPGPGHTVTISNNSVVTGSTAPADELMVLNQIDATPYATNNDNARICANAATCTATTYSDATKSLTVSGDATLGPGAYYLCKLAIKGTLHIAGSVTIWMGSPVACGSKTSGAAIESAGVVDVVSGRPRDFQVRMQGSTSVSSNAILSSKSQFFGILYAPSSTLTLQGGAHLFGSAAAGSVAAGAGGGFIHFDRSLG